MGLEFIAICGVLLLGAGIAVLVVNLGRDKGSATIGQIQTYGYVAEAAGGSEVEAPARRPLDTLAGRLGDLAARKSKRFGGEAEIRQKLISAGMYGTTPRKVLGYQVLCSISFALLALWMLPTMGASLPLTVLGAVGGGALGWFGPISFIDRKMRHRFDRIDRQLPEMIDLLVVTIEAGLGILASMRVAGDSMPDPLGQELRLTLQEQRMGLSVNQAIVSLGNRADTPNMRIFVRSLTQGEKLGVSIGATMRNLSIEMRKRRRAMAEERAQKMPIKMLFPLIFCIFPAMFIVLLVPMVINIIDALG